MAGVNNSRLLKKENSKHIDAFEEYYTLGAERSLQRVADKLGVTYKSVQIWNQSFNWAERITQRDVEIKKRVDNKVIKQVVDDIVKEKANYRKVVKLAIGKIIEEIRDGKMSYKIQDLDKLIRLDMFLLGESDSTVRVENNHSISEEDREVVEKLGQSLAGLIDELGEDE